MPALSALLAALGYPAPPEEVGRRLERLRTDSRAVVLVAECGAEVLGLATAHRFTALHAPAQVALFTALVVAESARGRGVGRQLVGAVEALAREAGCSRIVVTTAEHRAGAHAFYRQLGWEHTGRRFVKAPAGLPDGA